MKTLDENIKQIVYLVTRINSNHWSLNFNLTLLMSKEKKFIISMLLFTV